MPLTSLYLLALNPTTSIPAFIPQLSAALPQSSQPLLVARPLRWIIDPWISSPSARDDAALAALTSTTWDLLLIFPGVVDLPPSAAQLVHRSYALRVGVSARIIDGFRRNNAHLLHPMPGTVPPLTGSLDEAPTSSSSRDLHLTPAIQRWFASPEAPRTAPSMLNLLAMMPGRLDSYKAYGQAFAADVGARRGGVAKIMGTVPHDVAVGEDAPQQQVWDEVAVAHYPSVWHFADMVMGRDYQEVNARHRAGALRGTGILCCDELDREVLEGLGAARATKARI